MFYRNMLTFTIKCLMMVCIVELKFSIICLCCDTCIACWSDPSPREDEASDLMILCFFWADPSVLEVWWCCCFFVSSSDVSSTEKSYYTPFPLMSPHLSIPFKKNTAKVRTGGVPHTDSHIYIIRRREREISPRQKKRKSSSLSFPSRSFYEKQKIITRV